MRPRSFLALVLAACTTGTPRAIDVTAVNYAFRVAPRARPGRAVFRLINAGAVPHEVQIFRFRPGISADSGRALLAAERFPDSLADASAAVLIAAPGEPASEQVLVELRTGELYTLVCQFSDSATAPHHDRMGMFAVVQVTPEAP